jgi:glycosyltransferase involved in cell wall biosynthesis
MSPRVTIAIAVFNVEKYVEKCIESALCQDFDDFEVLVVDDGSKDGSVAIVERMAQTHPNGKRIRVVRHEKNTGTGGVRNTCIKEAKGEYLFFMDGDDYLASNSIMLLYDAMLANNADIVMGNHQMITLDGEEIYSSTYQPGLIESEYAIAQWMKDNNSNYYPVATWNKLFKTSFLRDSGIECVPWHRQEDIFFALQTSFVVQRIVTIPEITYYWVQVNGSCIHSEVTEWHLMQYLDIFDRCLILCDEKGKTIGRYPKELIWIITYRYLWGFITLNTCKSSLLSNKQKNDFLKHLKAITHYIRFCEEFDGNQRFVYTIIKTPFPYPIMRVSLKAKGFKRKLMRKLRILSRKVFSK